VFGAGYLTQAEWWRIGFLISLVHLAIWLPIGFLWWKAIGLW
jgi:DASS family divalent anion:Na+ symporter